MKIRISGKDVIWSYIGTFVSMGGNLIMLPFLMYFLDDEMLGLWYVFTGIGAFASLFDMGFSVTFSRNITYAWSGAGELRKENAASASLPSPDYALMKNILLSCRIIYAVLSSLALIILLSLGTLYIRYVSRSISSPSVLVSWVIYASAVFLNLYYGYFSSFLRGVGDVERAEKNAVYARSAEIILTLVLLYSGTGLIGVSSAYLVYGVLLRILGRHYFYRYEDIGTHLSGVGKAERKEIAALVRIVWHNAWRDGVISISNYFTNQASTLVCSLYLSLSEVGTYSLSLQIAEAVARISGTLYSAFQPQLQSAYVSHDREKTSSTMSLIVMAFIYIFILGSLAVIFFALPVLTLIKKDVLLSVPVLVFLLIYQFMLKFRNCYTSYFSSTNRIPYLKSFILSSILCLVLSFLTTGAMKMGIWGLIASEIISQAVCNVWLWPLLAHREMNLSFPDMMRNGTGECLKSIGELLKHRKKSGREEE